jgi:hypothetical protein
LRPGSSVVSRPAQSLAPPRHPVPTTLQHPSTSRPPLMLSLVAIGLEVSRSGTAGDKLGSVHRYRFATEAQSQSTPRWPPPSHHRRGEEGGPAARAKASPRGFTRAPPREASTCPVKPPPIGPGGQPQGPPTWRPLGHCRGRAWSLWASIPSCTYPDGRPFHSETGDKLLTDQRQFRGYFSEPALILRRNLPALQTAAQPLRYVTIQSEVRSCCGVGEPRRYAPVSSRRRQHSVRCDDRTTGEEQGI